MRTNKIKLSTNILLIFIFILMICQTSYTNALPSTGELNGVITDLRSSGSIKNAKVTISMGSNSKSVNTDQNGKYEFKNIVSGEYLVTVDAFSYNIATQNVTVSSGIRTINDFALTKKKVSLSGRVIDANTNKPVENVFITASDGQRDYSQTTDSNGNYIIKDLLIEYYDVTASIDNYNVLKLEKVLIEDDPTVKDFSISRQKGDITGKVINSIDKKPLTSVSILLSDGVNKYEATTDSNGIFTINNVNSGYYNMVASLNGYKEKQFTNILVQGSNMVSQDFELNKEALNLSGIVKGINNNPISGVSIFLTNGTTNYSSITDGSGMYFFSNLSAGIYTLTASLENYNMKSININVAGSGSNVQDITISKLNGKIAGSVIDSSNGNFVEGAKITATDGVNTYVEYSDVNGKYQFNNMALSKYKLTIEYRNYDVKTINDVVVTDFDTKVQDVQITNSNGILKGNVKNSLSGRDIENAKIEIINDVQHYTAYTNSNGDYVVDNVKEGKYEIIASKPNYTQSETYDVNIKKGNIVTEDFSIKGISGSMYGTVTDQYTKDPIAYAYIKITNDDNTITAIADVSGNYVKDYIPQGNYTVIASADGYNEYSIGNIEVLKEKSTKVDISLFKDPGTIIDEEPPPLSRTLRGTKAPIITAETPTIDNSNVSQPIVELVDPNANLISGTGIAGDKINVLLPDGTNLTTEVLNDGTWQINNLPTLNVGDKLIVNEMDPVTLDVSANVNVEIVDLKLPSTGEYIGFYYWINFSITFFVLLSLLCLMSISIKRPK